MTGGPACDTLQVGRRESDSREWAHPTTDAAAVKSSVLQAGDSDERAGARDGGKVTALVGSEPRARKASDHGLGKRRAARDGGDRGLRRGPTRTAAPAGGVRRGWRWA